MAVTPIIIISILTSKIINKKSHLIKQLSNIFIHTHSNLKTH